MDDVFEGPALSKLVHLALTCGVERIPVLPLVPGGRCSVRGREEGREGMREGGQEHRVTKRGISQQGDVAQIREGGKEGEKKRRRGGGKEGKRERRNE